MIELLAMNAKQVSLHFQGIKFAVNATLQRVMFPASLELKTASIVLLVLEPTVQPTPACPVQQERFHLGGQTLAQLAGRARSQWRGPLAALAASRAVFLLAIFASTVKLAKLLLSAQLSARSAMVLESIHQPILFSAQSLQVDTAQELTEKERIPAKEESTVLVE